MIPSLPQLPTCLFFLMLRRPPRSTRTYTLFPYTTRFRSSRERVRAAIAAIGLSLPPKVITVNLSPADLPKEGSHYDLRSEEHTSELQSLMRISYAVFCLKKKNTKQHHTQQGAKITSEK